MLINNCRLIGYSRFAIRIKFGVAGQESNPQSATIHSTIVSHHIENKKMIKAIRILILLFILANIGYSQIIPTKQDSAQLDSLTIMLEKIAREWNQEDEPWTFISFDIENLDLNIKFGQQSIHPFLAEYNRKIQFSTKNEKTDTLDMFINSGGRTWIEIFYDKKKELIIMEDNFGKYFFDLSTLEYYEKPYNFEPYENKEFIGIINGKDFPLKYEIKKQ